MTDQRSERPHVMHVIDSLAVGGAERMLVDIVNATSNTDYCVSVCITRNKATLAGEIYAYIPVKILDRKFNWDPKGFTRFVAYVKEQQVDLFHAHGLSTYSFLLAARQMGLISKPILLHDHFGGNRKTPIWFRNLGSHEVGFYVCVSSSQVEWAISAGVSRQKIALIENALDTDRYERYQPLDLHNLFNVPPTIKIGIMVGNLRYEKGLDLLIEVCAQLPANTRPLFIILGSIVNQQYVNDCLQRIHTQGLAGNFYFAGQQYDSLAWMKGADFAVMPSRFESGPLVLIEYLACGLPFVAFKVGEISEIVYQHYPDNFAPPEDTAQFSQRLETILNTPQSIFLEKKGSYVQTAYDLFDIQTYMLKWYSIYTQLLKPCGC